MKELGWNCYCYNDECNQKEWEKQGRTGKRQWTVVSDIMLSKELNPKAKVPKCPYCKKKMTVTANSGTDY